MESNGSGLEDGGRTLSGKRCGDFKKLRTPKKFVLIVERLVLSGYRMLAHGEPGVQRTHLGALRVAHVSKSIAPFGRNSSLHAWIQATSRVA